MNMEKKKNMAEWLPFALAALGFWVIWAFVPKLAMQKTDYVSFMAFEVAGIVVCALIFFAWNKFQISYDPVGSGLAFLVGFAAMLGAFLFFYALKLGPVGPVTVITSVYPMIAMILAWFFLGEAITPRQMIGAVFAMTGLALIVWKG